MNKELDSIKNSLRDILDCISTIQQMNEPKALNNERLFSPPKATATGDEMKRLVRQVFDKYGVNDERAELEHVKRQKQLLDNLRNVEHKGTLITSETEDLSMIINIPGISINSKPRKDGRYQGYITEHGVKYYVYGRTLGEVARKLKYFLQHGIPKKKKTARTNSLNGVPTTFTSFAFYYFENFRKKKVTELSYKIDVRRFKCHLEQYFKEKPLCKITPLDCQKLLDSLLAQGKGKTADEIRSLMSVIFKMAIKHDVMNKNPLDVVYYEQHERESGKALLRSEEQKLKLELNGSPFLPPLMVALYTGLRPNEWKTARIEGEFIVAKNSKRKTKRIEYKKIPIIKALRPYVKNGIATFGRLEPLRLAFKSVLPEHKLYDLRTTFYTRCKEYNVDASALNEFFGHSSGRLGNAYTDLPDEYLLKEAKKLDAWE